jgi:hypothetical protein
MNRKLDQPAEGSGLLASGSSRRWEVAVDESLDRDEWSVEIEGPQAYLVFQLRDLGTIPEALDFLRAGPQQGPVRGRHERPAGEHELNLGRFGSAPVSLVWDDEDFPRCFIIVSPNARSTLRLSLDSEDIQMLIEALDQTVKSLPQEDGQ